MLVNRRTLRIEWGQCDPAGIVFYPQYLIIFDNSTGWLFERTGLTPSLMRKKYGIVGMPVVEVGARFLNPCRFDDEIVVESEVSEWGRSSFTVRHRVLKEGELALDVPQGAGPVELPTRPRAAGVARRHHQPQHRDRPPAAHRSWPTDVVKLTNAVITNCDVLRLVCRSSLRR